MRAPQYDKVKTRYNLIFRFDLDFWEWVIEINWYTYWHAMYVVMIAMLLHALNSLLSAWGTFTQNRTVLLISVILR